MKSNSLQLINLSAVDSINFASAQNSVPILQSIGIKNMEGESISNLRLEMSPYPPFCRAKSWIVDRITANSEISLSDLRLEYDFSFFEHHNEAERGQLNFTLRQAEHVCVEQSIPIRILARDEWGGLGMSSMLAAFVSPNESTVAQICKHASILLENAGHSGALNGYQTNNPKRSYMLAAGIWSAITALALSYAEPPASFENTGQKVRSPNRIKDEGLATCLDSSLLFAGTLEAVGLNPVIIFTKGHAFSGVWLIDKTLPAFEETDIVNLRKAIAAREFIAFETTLVTARPVSSFPHAIECARGHLSEAHETNFERAIDIRRARSMGITPLASRCMKANSGSDNAEISPAALPPEPDFGLLPSEIVDDGPQTPQDRIDRWQRKLLDLTLRNRLLNFKDTKQTIPVLCPDLPKLEDVLADGGSLRIISIHDEKLQGARDLELFRQQHGKDVYEEFARNALDRKQICIPISGNDMRNRLITLYRKANSELIEGGANTLYLAVGFLRWKKSENDLGDYRAPILLLPVSLKRRSAQSDFYLTHHEDEVRINLTLLQFLQRNFGLQIRALEGELPKDDAGIDVPFIFAAMRQAVRDVPNFEVIEEAALSTFSFAKYLMWKDLVDRTADLRNNRLVKHLIDAPETPFIQNCDGPCLPLPSEIDKRTSPHDLLTPLPADSSQLAAVVAATKGHDFVVIGPPGTGKSQTIANMIAQCLAVGKRVLFVAEKSAALDVVYRRLKAYGLGDACLELHSNKADRKKVLHQLDKAWDRNEYYSSTQWQIETDKLKEVRDRLNQYVEELHAPGSHGFSIFQAIGIVVGQQAKFALKFDNLSAHDPAMLDRLSETAERAARAYSIICDYDGFDTVCKPEWSFAWENELIKSAAALLTTIYPLKKTSLELAKISGLDIKNSINFEIIRQLSRFYEICQISSSQDFSQIVDAELDQLELAAVSLDSAITTIRQSRTSLTGKYDDAELKRIPVDDIDRQWRDANSKMWPFSAFERRRIKKLLQSYATEGKVDVAKEITPLRNIQCSLAELSINDISKLPIFDNENTDPKKVSQYLNQARILQESLIVMRSCAGDISQLSSTLETLFKNKQQHGIMPFAQDFHEKYVTFQTAFEAYFSYSGGVPYAQSLDVLEQHLQNLIKNKSRLADWTQWVNVREEALNLGLSPYIEALIAGKVDVPKQDFLVAYFSWWLPLAIDTCSELRCFRHWSHQDLIKEFKKRDEAVLKLTAHQVLAKTTHTLPKRDMVSRRSELGTLKHQLSLQRPSVSIRNLIELMPTSFTKLAPCMLMSPLSVAQYLPSNQAQFDVIIFDEASQITTWDAVGAIARAQQSVIVGDPKQLPPTNFFGRSDDEDEEDLVEYEKDLPSILEEASAAGLPEIQLNWHYRSRDESLIAFSNWHYYNGRLVTFPSPQTDSHSIIFHKNNGVYARGTGRNNIEEAREIVQFSTNQIMQWMQLPEADRPTLGVITFNIQQQELILNLFDKARQNDPSLEWYFSDEREEPVIVKNIENIQGDERDIMCFSITFGRDLAGKISMSFGAVNRDGGEKRLNVAVTRARLEMHIFSSITAEDIDTSRTRALGVTHLQNFLDYAQHGSIALAAMNSDSIGDAESPFEEAVMASLRDKGWEVRTQIGVSNYRIDLGIVHPDHAGAYLAGLECDGATYHRSASARDRDKIRESILRNLGWNIVRVWSTDWFMNSKEALERINNELLELLKTSRLIETNKKQTNKETDEANNCTSKNSFDINPTEFILKENRKLMQHSNSNIELALPGLPTSTPQHEPPNTTPYFNTNSTLQPPSEGHHHLCADATRFFDSDYQLTLTQLIDSVVKLEGPIEIDRLAQKICKLHGWNRTGAKIKQRILECLGNNELHNEGEKTFAWESDSFKGIIPYKNIPERDTVEISRHEIFGLITSYPGLTVSDDIVRDIADIMGIKRLSQKSKNYIQECVKCYADFTKPRNKKKSHMN